VIIMHGDLLETPFQFIAHQVNCMGVMGAGLAKQIAQRYPFIYAAYRDYCADWDFSEELLGKAFGVGCNDGHTGHIIYNLFGQYKYGRDKKYTNEAALEEALWRMIDDIRFEWSQQGDSGIGQICIAIPYKIGCGLGGGNWEEVKAIFENIEKSHNVLFVAYDIRREIL